MSLVLSIYSQKGFREVTLPMRGQGELRVLLQKELFSLSQDMVLNMERVGEQWFMTVQGGNVLNAPPATGANQTRLGDGLKFEVGVQNKGEITILVFERSDPMTVYQKYSLAGIRQITIGRHEENDIQYQNDFVSGQHCVISLENGRATLRDMSTNGTYLNYRRVFGNTVLKYGDSIRIMRLNIIYLGNMIAVHECDHLSMSLSQMSANNLETLCAKPSGAGAGVKALYHRSPRNLRKLHTEPFEIEAPPAQQPLREQPLAMQIGPAMTMAIPMLLGSLMSAIASRSTGTGANAFMYLGMVTAVASALIGAIWAIINVRYARKQYKQADNQRFERYSEYLIRMRDKIERAYNENTEALRERYISAEACCALNERSPLLWNRNVSHEDFLSIRLGVGDIPFQADIVIPQERFTMFDDSLADKPNVIRENYKILKDVPVTVDLLQQRLVGIVGGDNRKEAIAVARAMIAQIASSNCYTDVKIALVGDETNDIDRNMWDFAMWLPHVWSSDKKIRYMATSHAERGEVFYALTQLLRGRSDEKEQTRDIKPHIILFVTDPSLLDGEGISKYVFEREQDIGLATIILSDKPENLPNECECVIECDQTFRGIYDMRSGREHGTAVRFDWVSDDGLWKLSKALGRIEVVESGQDGEIPNSLTFFEMYGIEHPQELNAPERWKKANTIATMRALVGFRGGNVPCYLDINEKYHGPHGLVAGTTGSGKSETLQTYILSLAVNFSPEYIGFFIIDYKGGGMANLFDGLPHMIGSISNLSGNQVNRAMVSIQSENRRRQRIFAEYGVNNINGYTALYQNGDAAEPIPHLFIIIDEFAELKREEPEFMKELISVAQVGRSLGVHLILSTQRPSGTVDENIWANSKFRLCLRVQDRQDSIDMLHRPEAAYLSQAGRCYLQVGNDEIFELFQSGWSGASYDEELSGGNLIIAQMLNTTGKVDLAGNHAKIKRKEEIKRRWIAQLIKVLQDVEQETGISVARHFALEEQPQFLDLVYQGIRKIQPDFERNQFNTIRIHDLCTAYAEVDVQDPIDKVADEVIRSAGRIGGRLPEVKGKTQLEVVVDYLAKTSEALGLGAVRKLWLPVLPEYLYLDALETRRRTFYQGNTWPEKPVRFQLSATIGMADDPENQAQFPVALDFAGGGHHLLTGTVSTGKSTFLQTVIYSLASSYTPDILNIYCLDFSSKMLSVFSKLKHVGGYMDESDVENDQIGKFFTMITQILDERKRHFAGTNFEDYVNHNGWIIPAILIVIDNYGVFHEKTGEAYEAVMTRLAKEGIGCGIFLIVTAGGISMQELPSRMAENFRTGLSLEMPDLFAYSDVLHVVRPPVLPESRVKGRGLMNCDGRILEFQTALAEHAEGGPERNDLIKATVERMNAVWTGPQARAVPRIPEKPVRSDFTSLVEYREALDDPHLLPIGYDFEYASVYSFNLVQSHLYLITGTKNSGKSNFMENLILTCAQRGDEVAVLDIGGGRFAHINDAIPELRYCGDGASALELFTYIQSEMVRRAPIKKTGMDKRATAEELFDAALENPRIDIFVSNMQAFVAELHDSESPAFNAQTLFDTLCERGNGYNIFVFGEMGDREQDELMGYACVDSMRSCQTGIRFGGKFNDQKIFSFENIRYQDQDRGMKPGVGVIPSDDNEERLVRVVVPLAEQGIG